MIINLLVIGFTLVGIQSILFTKNGLEKSLQFMIFAFVLGYRTFEPIPGLKLHPIEILVYVSIIRIIVANSPKYLKMPKSVFVLGVFFVIFFIIDLITKYNQWALLEFKNSFLIILIFFIVQHIHLNKAYIIGLLKIYLFSASLISIIGILEYIFPSMVAAVFGFQEQSQYAGNMVLFSRMAFLFWGSHLAANLIPPVFPILVLLKSERDSTTSNNYFLTLLIIINLFAIYLSGNRISWLIVTVLLIAIIFNFRGSLLPYMKTYTILITIGFVAYIYSQPVEGRYISTFKALTGQIDTRYDSSGGVRLARAKTALKSMILNPLGTGWGTQGWVHSDILQVGASNGIIPGTILFFAPFLLLLRTYRCYSMALPDEKPVFFTLCGLLIFIIISLFFNGNFYLVQCGVPLFIIWALVYGYTDKYNKSVLN